MIYDLKMFVRVKFIVGKERHECIFTFDFEPNEFDVIQKVHEHYWNAIHIEELERWIDEKIY